MQERREPVFGQTNSAIEQEAGGRPREVHVHVHHRWDQGPGWAQSTVLWIGGLFLAALLVFAAVRWYQMKVLESAMNQVTKATATVSEQARRAAAEAQARAARAEADRAAAKRQAAEAEAARVAAINAEAARRDAAWQKFYVRSGFCRNPDNRTTMECANEHARAKKEFDRRWAAGELR